LLKKYQIYPSKRLGQNFLIDKRVIRKIIKAANLKSEDIVLEIGPGIGVLTIELAKKAGKVIAIEKDPNLARILNNELRIKNIKNVEIIQGDILKIQKSKTEPVWTKGEMNAKHSATIKIQNSYKVVANLPYYITSPVIRKFLEEENPPKAMVLMVQKEVAQRICANPPDMSILAVSVQFYAEPKIIAFVSKKSFWPQSKVDSAIIKITPRKKWSRTVLDQLFFKVVKAGFSQPRKQLINNLSKGLGLEREEVKSWLLKNDILPSQRAETLSVADWINLLQSCRIS